MASLLESASLRPAIVLVPGHAFVGWAKGSETDELDYLETTMIGSHDFASACQYATQLFDEFKKSGLTDACGNKIPHVLTLDALRRTAYGRWSDRPMI